ncbi:hypothetical protein IQ37_15475 [Chryseobacterium piperi]|uniref:Uncharacterized protein n=1 Tax=Chryseobacterium piperi TaxID=558152 RepID=A0A086AWN7_9FLAO|nr:hypothetical protein [Chryseobacterium piperi]ASW73463.1 hypothetical protein CJF12_03595 [Chryseobacterium piperi]KFF21101.1 hypothetical protein IQ37_15475 [Chryseobacterium piperi]
MQSLQFKPFSKSELIEGLRNTFPKYKIQTSFGALQVRTSGFTITGNVKINAHPETGRVSTQTNNDMSMFYLIFSFPIAIYIMTKKEKIKQLENEVVEGLKKILEQQN